MTPLLPSDLPRAALVAVTLALAACSPDSKLQLGEERIAATEAGDAAAMIAAIRAVSLREAGDGPLRRFNQGKTLGCFAASFDIAGGLPEELRQGIFAEAKGYPAQLRFANASADDDRARDFRGLSIKLREVAGEPLWGQPGVQDFLFNSHPALFAATPGDFRDFVQAAEGDALWRYFLHPGHWYSLGVVVRGREKITNPFAIPYWSTTPYRFGDSSSRAVKYSLRPCADSVPQVSVKPAPDMLAAAMAQHLAAAPACFDFMVQFQTDPDTMPIENAAKPWDESASPFVKVASVHIPQGDASRLAAEDCEAMTFNPWQSLDAHRPLGGINRVRLPIYAEIGRFRSEENARRGAADDG